MPLKNITLFGPAHSGKSTIAGLFQYYNDPEAAERVIQQAKRELGIRDYESTQDLAYLVDRSHAERVRSVDRPGESTSKQLHFTQTTIPEKEDRAGMDMLIIDTPGGWNWTRRTRVRGMYYAEIAVFVIDFKTAKSCKPHQLAGHPTKMTETFGALFSWIAIKPDAPLIVAITQLDLSTDQPADFKAAADAIRGVLDSVCTPVIIPTAVNVAVRTSKNVMTAANLGSGSYGPCLRDAIFDAAKTLPAPVQVDQNVMIVSRELPKPGFGTGFFGKVLSGSFATGDTVQMAPITHTNGKPFRYSGKLRMIMSTPGDASIDQLEEGDLGGLFFRTNRSKMGEIADGTIVVDSDTQLAMGRFVRVVLDAGAEQPEWLRFGVEIELLWFGRYSTMKVCEIRSTESGRLKVSLLMKSLKQLAMPLSKSDGRPLFASAQIGRMKDTMTYTPCEIRFVGSVRGIRIHSSVYGLSTPRVKKSKSNQDCEMEALPVDTSNVEALLKRLDPTLSDNGEKTIHTTSFELIDSGEDFDDD